MVLEHQPAWRPHLRSKAAMRQAPRRHFCDPSRAVAALGASPERLLTELAWMGQLFESLVIRDLCVLAQSLDGEVFHDRDNDGVEVDAIVQLHDGRWSAQAHPPFWRWCAARATGIAGPMASPWCRRGPWDPDPSTGTLTAEPPVYTTRYTHEELPRGGPSQPRVHEWQQPGRAHSL